MSTVQRSILLLVCACLATGCATLPAKHPDATGKPLSVKQRKVDDSGYVDVESGYTEYQTADGSAPGAYPELEELVPPSFEERAPDRLDSGRNCTDENLGTLAGDAAVHVGASSQGATSSFGSRAVTRFTENGSRLLSVNHRANFLMSRLNAFTVGAAKSWAARYDRNRSASPGPTGTPSNTLSAGFRQASGRESDML